MSISSKVNYYIYKEDQLLVKKDTDVLTVPGEREIDEVILNKFTNFYIGELNSKKCYAIEVTDNFNVPEDYMFQRLYNCRWHYNEQSYKVAVKAFLIINWNRNHRYCSKCGKTLEPMADDNSKTCSNCQKIYYPDIAPAIIVAILKDDKILLAHNRRFKENLYSLIAGFVEPGETFEETVKREIAEEVGIKVQNIHYFESQPWPFPNSLMIGFTAEYQSGEIKVDGEEIVKASWFTPDNFPELPGEGSLSRIIIDWYIENYYLAK